MVTVLTRTIGPSGRDYATFTLASADVPNIGTSGDLVANDEAIVFEADAADYTENWQFSTRGAITCDATRNVTFTHAAGASHGGQFESGVNIIGYAIVGEDFAIVDGLSVSPASGGAGAIIPCTGAIFRNMMCYSQNSTGFTLQRGGTAAAPCVLENCVAKTDSGRALDFRAEGVGDSHWRVVNVTAIQTDGLSQAVLVGSSSTGTIYLEVVNTLLLGLRGYYAMPGSYTLSLTGQNNFGPAGNPLPPAIQGIPNPIVATTNVDPGVGDWAIYDSATGALIDDPDNDVINMGIGPDANSDVPTTDIVGTLRVGTTTDPGAFVLPYVADSWTPIMVKSYDPVDVSGVLIFGDAYINAVQDTLTATGPSATDVTPAIPVGTSALWVQLISQSGTLDAGDAFDIQVEVNASQAVTLATMNALSTDAAHIPGLHRFAVDCQEQSTEATPLYPRVKLVNSSGVDAGEVVTVRVVAIGQKQTNVTWS